MRKRRWKRGGSGEYTKHQENPVGWRGGTPERAQTEMDSTRTAETRKGSRAPGEKPLETAGRETG